MTVLESAPPAPSSRVAPPSSRAARLDAWVHGDRPESLPARALLVLAYSNVLIALNGAGLAVIAQLAAGRRPALVPTLVPMCTMFAVYSFDKAARFDPQDELNDPDRTRFLKLWRVPILTLAALALAAAIGLSFAHGVTALVLTVAPVTGAMLYMFPFLPKGFRYRRLKDITFGKSLTVAVCWVVGCALAPLEMVGALSWRAAFVGGAWGAVRAFVNTVYFDIGDLEGDRLEGTVTIPVWLGHRATLGLLVGLDLASSALVVFAVHGLGLAPELHVLHAITLYGIYYLWRARRPEADLSFLCDVVVDSELVVAAAVLWSAVLVSAA